MPAPRDHELCFGCQQPRANHPNDSGCQEFHTTNEEQRERAQQLCASCGNPRHNHKLRHRFVAPEPEPEPEIEDVNASPIPPQEEGSEPGDDGRPSQAENKGEMVRRYSEQHLCIGCGHVEVCEVGRHTSELFRDGWYVVISVCNTFEEG